MKFNKKAILFAATLATSVLVSVAASADTAIHRAYYPGNGAHLWTSDTNEVNVLTTSRGWKNEGVAWVSPDKGETVTRLYNPVLKKHLYTKDQNEVKVLTSQHGYRNEGQVFKSGGSTPIYRLYNPKLSPVASHHYTTDKNEYDTLAAKHGWKKEGVAFYANGKHLPSAPTQGGSTNPSSNAKPGTSTGTQTQPSKPAQPAQPSGTKPSQPATTTGSSTSTSTGSSTQTQPSKPAQPSTPNTTPSTPAKQYTRYTEIYNGSRKLERKSGTVTVYPDRTTQTGGYEVYQDQNGNLYTYQPGEPVNGSEYVAMGFTENGRVRTMTVNDWATWDKANQLQANIYANQAAIQDYWMKRVTEIRQAEGRPITAENSKPDMSSDMLNFSKARIEEQRNVGSYYGWDENQGRMVAAHTRPIYGAYRDLDFLLPENANINVNDPNAYLLRQSGELSTASRDLTYTQATDFRLIIEDALTSWKRSPGHWNGIMGSQQPQFLSIGIYPNQNGTYSTVVHAHELSY